jgi:hypothetical protein
MTPKQVPADLVTEAVDALEDLAHEGCGQDTGCVGFTREYHEQLARQALAAVLPTHAEQLVRRLAEQTTGMVVHGPAGVGIHCETCDRSQLAASDDVDASFALATILGHATSPEHTAHGGQS